MTTASNPSASGTPAGAHRQSGTNSGSEDRVLRWNVIVPLVLIAAVVLLLGLPLGAVFIMNSSCCLADGPENVVTFWASMTAGFLALFGMIITAVFIITAFRVDATAQAKAQVVAQEAVWNYLKNEQAELVKDLECLKALMKKVKECGESAQLALTKAKDDVEMQQKDANSAITAAEGATTNAAREAQEAVAKALEETTSAAKGAQEAIGKALQEVQGQHDEAIRAIGEAQQEAEDAARAVRERADQSAEGPTPPERDGPEETR